MTFSKTMTQGLWDYLDDVSIDINLVHINHTRVPFAAQHKNKECRMLGLLRICVGPTVFLHVHVKRSYEKIATDSFTS